METLVFRILFYSAAGIFISHGIVSQSQMSRRYFMIHGLIVTVPAVLSAFFLKPLSPAFFFFIFCSITFALLAGVSRGISFGMLLLGAFAAGLVISLDLLQPAFESHSGLTARFFFVSNSVLSVLVLGFSISAMLLGHWYLVQPTLSISQLMRLTYCLIGTVITRFLLGSYVCYVLLAGKSEIEVYAFCLRSPGLFVLMRYLWGILGPMVLGCLIWETVRIRSTRSATGILYVTVLCVLTGEILSQYLALFHGIPF